MSVVSFHSQGMLPERIDHALLLGNWRKLEEEIRDGFPVNAQAYGGTSLFEMILSAAETHPKGPATLPASLLEALVEGGLAEGELVDGSGLTAVTLCAEYAQWEWMEHLLGNGFQLDTPEWPSIFMLAVGRAARFRSDIDDLMQKHQESQLENEDASSDGYPHAPPVASDHAATSPSTAGSGNVFILRPSASPGSTPSPSTSTDQGEDVPVGISIEPALARRAREIPGMLVGLDVLLAHGADINAVPSSQQETIDPTPAGVVAGGHALMEALRDGDRALIMALAMRGADVVSTRFAWSGTPTAAIATPLVYCLSHPDAPIVELLIDSGAPLCAGLPIPSDELQSCTLARPYSPYAPLRECIAIADGVDRSDLVRLLASRLEADELVEQGGLAFQQAAAQDRVDYMEILFQAGVPMTHKTRSNGFMAIHQACANGSAKAIEYLLVHGVKLSDTSSAGVTAASMLAKHPHLVDRFDARQDMGNVRLFRPR